MIALIEHETCEKIIQTYYKEIYSYCFAKLSYRQHPAEDCTQEVFIVFFSKHEKLSGTDNIRLWLYRTADNIIKAYIRKNYGHEVSIEDNPEVYNIPAESSFPDESADDPFEVLTEEEKKLLEAYYDTDYGQRSAAAKKMGISLAAMYQRVHKIKKKLRDDQERKG